MNRFDKHEKGDKIKWAIIFTVVAALIVGFFAIVTKGFKQNDPKTWFGGEHITASTQSTVEVSSGVKLASELPDLIELSASLDRVTFDYTVSGYFYQHDGASLLTVVLTNSSGAEQQKKYDHLFDPSKTINLLEEFNLTVGETYTIEATHIWYIGADNSSGGGETEKIIFSYGIELPETPSKTGYNFIGWYYDEAFTRPYDSGKITADTQLYARFELINYNIVYNSNGGTVDGNTSYNIETETYTLPTPTRTGYNFLGWYDNANFTGEPISEIPKGSTGDKTYYAKWEIQTFKVSFYVDGELYLEMDVEYGTSLINLYLVDTSTMAAVAFSLDADMLTAYSMDSLITNDISLFAANDFVIYAGLTYNIDGVETMDLLDYNSTLSDLRVPEKDGYTFDGWYYDSEYTQAVQSTDKLTQNKTIYAKFTKIPTVSSFWNKLGAFFRKWWWAFAVGGAAIIAIVIVSVVYTQKKKG